MAFKIAVPSPAHQAACSQAIYAEPESRRAGLLERVGTALWGAGASALSGAGGHQVATAASEWCWGEARASRQLTPGACSLGTRRSWRSRSSRRGGSRRSCAASSRACGGSWSGSGGWQGQARGSGRGQTAWTPRVSPPSAPTQTKVSGRKPRACVGRVGQVS